MNSYLCVIALEIRLRIDLNVFQEDLFRHNQRDWSHNTAIRHPSEDSFTIKRSIRSGALATMPGRRNRGNRCQRRCVINFYYEMIRSSFEKFGYIEFERSVAALMASYIFSVQPHTSFVIHRVEV